MLPVIEIAEQSHEFSGIKYPASAAAESLLGRTRYMEAMLTEIATWLSMDLDLFAIGAEECGCSKSGPKLHVRFSGTLKALIKIHSDFRVVSHCWR